MNRDPYWVPDCTKPPADDGSPTPQTDASKPPKLKYPWILGRPGWIAAGGGNIRAYRFNDGHVYEFPTTVPSGGVQGVLQTSPVPEIRHFGGTLIQGYATYTYPNGPLTEPGKYIE